MMVKELDKYEAELKGDYINAVLHAMHQAKSYAEEATDIGRSWAIETAISELAENWRPEEIESIALNILILLSC